MKKESNEIVSELLELYNERCGNDPTETVKEIVYILDEIRNNPDDFTLKLDMLLEDYANDNNVCSMCGEELRPVKTKEFSEYQGFPCYEEDRQLECPNHGII